MLSLSFLSDRPSVRPHVSAQLSLEDFPLNFISETFIQLGRENQILGKFGHKYRTDLSRFYCCRRHEIAIKALLTAATCTTTRQAERVFCFSAVDSDICMSTVKRESYVAAKAATRIFYIVGNGPSLRDQQTMLSSQSGTSYVRHMYVICTLPTLSCTVLLYLHLGTAVLLDAWSSPEGCRKLRFPDFIKTAQDGCKVVSLTHQQPLPQENTPDTHFC